MRAIGAGCRARGAMVRRQLGVKWTEQPKCSWHQQSMANVAHVVPPVVLTTTTRGFAADKKERPFKILGLQQVAVGGLDKKILTRLWSGLLGVEKIGSYESKGENVSEDILTLGHGMGAVEVDLMEPLDPEKSPKVHAPALNHIGLWVHPLPECVEWLTQQGMRFTPGGIRKGASGHDVAFIHPKGNADHPLSGEGVLIELVQAPPDICSHSKKS